jgi:putative GTP pyrophosphokinase
MAFSPVPKESKNQINKAGNILTKVSSNLDELGWALTLVNKWRSCHAYPINTFQATLRRNIYRYEDPIIAQRLKRMPTIIDKLRRYPAMKLTTMQDIGGIRAVLATLADVNRLAATYKTNKRLTHKLIDEKNYIQHPRSEDGYRSVHLIYKYINRRNPAYNGLRLELQIRTKLQHTWATAVETMGTFLGQALKSRQGDQEWLDFFAVTSSAFAYMEKCNPIPRFSSLSENQTYIAVAKAEADIRALEKMQGFSVAVDSIVKTKSSGKRSFYHLIILNSLQKTVQIKPYRRDNFKQAIQDYSKVEEEAAKGIKIEPVLVSAGSLDAIRHAYPNFFLDIDEFAKSVNQILDKVNQ